MENGFIYDYIKITFAIYDWKYQTIYRCTFLYILLGIFIAEYSIEIFKKR